MAQYVERKCISKNIPPIIPPNILAISYNYSSKYPHNRLSENYDLMLLCRRFSIKIDVISNELLWHSMLRGNSTLKIFLQIFTQIFHEIFPKIFPEIFTQILPQFPTNIPTIDFQKIMTLCCSIGYFQLKLMSYPMNRCGIVYWEQMQQVTRLNCFVQ